MSTAIALTIAMLLLPQAQVFAQEDDECMFGPSSLKELMDKESFQQNEKILTMATDIYNNALRQEEIKKYIEDNEDIPDYLDSDIIICGIASDIREKESKQDIIFDEDQLHGQTQLEILRVSVNAIDSYLQELGKEVAFAYEPIVLTNHSLTTSSRVYCNNIAYVEYEVPYGYAAWFKLEPN